MKVTSRCFVVAALLFAACGVDEPHLSQWGADRPDFDEWLAKLPRTASGAYGIEGDIATHNLDDVRAYFDRLYPPAGALVINQELSWGWTGPYYTDIKWSAGQKRKLTFCVSNSFATTDEKFRVVESLGKAAAGWESAADVDFIYKPEQDDNCTSSNTAVVFNVRPAMGTEYGDGGVCKPGVAAEAFRPNEGRSGREIILCMQLGDNSNVAGPNGLRATMRHELGHALGFAHEFIVDELTGTGYCDDDGPHRVVSGYPIGPTTNYGGADPYSIMTYAECPFTPDPEFFTDYDMEGVASVYGTSSRYDVAPADYDSDGILDLAVRTGVNGNWHIKFSTERSTKFWDFIGPNYGTGQVAPGNYDGVITRRNPEDLRVYTSARADISVKNDATGEWCIDYADRCDNRTCFVAPGVGYGSGRSSLWTGGIWGTTDPFDECYAGYGGAESRVTQADYDGDGKTDLSVKDNAGVWYIDYSRDAAPDGRPFGQWNAVLSGYGDGSVTPVPADYDGDGRADIAIKTSAGEWFIDYSNDFRNPACASRPCFGSWNLMLWGSQAIYGGSEWTPVPADYDGDCKADLAMKSMYGDWFIDYASNGYGRWDVTLYNKYGDSNWLPIPGKWHPNSDGKCQRADIATQRKWTTTVDKHWYVDLTPVGVYPSGGTPDGVWDKTYEYKQ